MSEQKLEADIVDPERQALAVLIGRALDGVIRLSVASCSCMTKHPDPALHEDDCRYRLIEMLHDNIDAIAAWNLRAERPGWREGWEAAREEAAKVADTRQAKWATTPTQGKQNAIMMEALEIEAILIAKAIRALHLAEGRPDEKI